MTDTGPLRRAVTVPLRPEEAFDLFTAGIDGWWPRRPGGAASRMRLAPGRDGALREEAPGQSPRVWARVTVWEPGRRLVLTWTEGHPDGEEPSEVEVRFTPVEAGTRVDLTHAALAPPEPAPDWAAATAGFAGQALRRSRCSPLRSPAGSWSGWWSGAWPARGKVTVSR